jgi:hypothetical protein
VAFVIDVFARKIVGWKLSTSTGRLWAYVRDDRPFGSRAPLAVIYHYSRNRRGEHPVAHLAGWHGLLQADAYGGYNGLVDARRQPAPVTRALCWANARRYFFKLADAATQLKQRRKTKIVVAPLAVDAVRQMDAIFAIERAIVGQNADERLAIRQQQVAPLVTAFHDWMVEHRSKLSRGSDVATAMDYMLKDWPAFTAFLADGRICMTNNAAERAMRGIAIGRKAWLFAGSDRGGQRAAFMFSLIATAKLNDVDAQAWLADVLARIADIPRHRLGELLPWNWKAPREQIANAA